MIDPCAYLAIIISGASFCACVTMKFINYDSDDDCCFCYLKVSNLHTNVIIVEQDMNQVNNIDDLLKYGEDIIYNEFGFQNELPSPPNYSEISFE